ncbi:MAG: hypothetical protein ACI9TI_001606, partial [Natronomonas sp.]
QQSRVRLGASAEPFWLWAVARLERDEPRVVGVGGFGFGRCCGIE